MKINELRLGVFVDFGGEIFRVRSIGGSGMIYVGRIDEECYYDIPVGEAEGIELTDDWLVRLGFKCDSVGIWHLKEKAVGLIYNDINDLPFFFQKDLFCCSNKLKYVHQLQNLCFVLTGEELEAKDA